MYENIFASTEFKYVFVFSLCIDCEVDCCLEAKRKTDVWERTQSFTSIMTRHKLNFYLSKLNGI